MALSSRDRWLSTIIFPLLTAIVYGFGPGAAVANRYKAAANDLNGAQQTAADPRLVNFKREELARSNEQLEQEKKMLAARKAMGLNDASKSPEALKMISETFEVHNLILQKCSHVVQTGDVPLPGRLKELMLQTKTKIQPQIWQVEFIGSYSSTVDALMKISSSDSFIIPLRITMNAVNSEQPIQWTVTFWL